MTNTYITPLEYLRGNSGQETASLVGNVGRLSGAHALGVTALNTRLANATTRPILFGLLQGGWS